VVDIILGVVSSNPHYVEDKTFVGVMIALFGVMLLVIFKDKDGGRHP